MTLNTVKVNSITRRDYTDVSPCGHHHSAAVPDGGVITQQQSTLGGALLLYLLNDKILPYWLHDS
jgi:hypothetical protein